MNASPKEISCFVIMPYGQRAIRDGIVVEPLNPAENIGPTKDKIIDFDKIYEQLIEKAIETIRIKGKTIKCLRCDKIPEAGWIHFKMFEQIHEADVAIVDITALNPNVFYELGIRHALAKRVTVLIRQAGTKIPFNIHGLKVIEYPEDVARIKQPKINPVKDEIVSLVKNGLNSRRVDSPVHLALNLKIGADAHPIPEQHLHRYGLRRARGKEICLITGDLQQVKKKIDIWVSSENTNMQMSRHYERSISGLVRFLGAKRDEAERVIDDVIANELAQIVGENAYVTPGRVIATGAGELRESHGVKKIFHAATVIGQPGEGYTQISNIGACVQNALRLADDGRFKGLTSILFPLMGTGQGRGTLDRTVTQLIGSAISYLETNSKCRIQKVYFITRTYEELDACQQALQLLLPKIAPLRQQQQRPVKPAHAVAES